MYIIFKMIIIVIFQKQKYKHYYNSWKKLPLENMVLFSHMCNIHLVVVFKKDVR